MKQKKFPDVQMSPKCEYAAPAPEGREGEQLKPSPPPQCTLRASIPGPRKATSAILISSKQ